MATKLWVDLELCTVANVKSENSDLQLVLSKVSGGLEEDCARMILVQKEEMEQELLIRLPELFVNNELWLGSSTWSGYTYDNLDTILDKLTNPGVLKRAAVAGTIRAMLRDALSRWRPGMEASREYLMDLLELWDKEYAQRMKLAVPLLKPDLNEDGQITPNERTRTRGIIWPA